MNFKWEANSRNKRRNENWREEKHLTSTIWYLQWKISFACFVSRFWRAHTPRESSITVQKQGDTTQHTQNGVESKQNICLINLLSHETWHLNNRLIRTFWIVTFFFHLVFSFRIFFFMSHRTNKIKLHLHTV